MPNHAEIARINGAKSKGPVTAEGKAIASRNAERHGLTSTRIVLPHESQDEYDRLEQAFLNTYRPADAVESDLVREMVASRWRMRRIEQMETAVLKKALKARQDEASQEEGNLHPDDAAALAFADVAESKALRTVTRHSAQLRRAYEKATRELALLQENRTAEAERLQAQIIEAELENTGLQNEPAEDEAIDRFVEEYLRPPAEFRGYIAQQLAAFPDNPLREAA